MASYERYNGTLDITPEQQGQQQLPNEDYYRQPPAPRQSGNTRRLGIALLLVGLVWLAVTIFSRDSFFGGGLGGGTLVDQTLPGARLEMDVGSADVELRPWNGEGIRVEAKYRGGAPADYDVNITQSGGTVRVTGDQKRCFMFCARSLNYQVLLPEGVETNVRTASGEIDIDGTSGPASLTTVSGDVEASNLSKGVMVNTTSGDITLRSIEGRLDVATTSGEVELNDGQVNGAAVRTTSGKVELQGVSNALSVESVSGDITIRDAHDARLTVSTTSGQFEYTGSLALDGENTINTISGDVTLHLPETASFRLEANTISGELESDFDLSDAQQSRRELSGTVGDGQATLKIQTTSGDVNVDRR